MLKGNGRCGRSCGGGGGCRRGIWGLEDILLVKGEGVGRKQAGGGIRHVRSGSNWRMWMLLSASATMIYSCFPSGRKSAAIASMWCGDLLKRRIW